MKVTVSYGTDVRPVAAEEGSTLGAAIVATGLPLEQPCAGRGTCHKCKVIAQGALSPLDEKRSIFQCVVITQAHRSQADQQRGLAMLKKRGQFGWGLPFTRRFSEPIAC